MFTSPSQGFMDFFTETFQISQSTPPSDLYRSVYSEIEEVGWKHLVSFERDPSSVNFSVIDENERKHILEIRLPQNYPESSPSIAADVPYICEFKWSMNSRLKDIVQQFQQLLQKLQKFWSTMDSIDKNLLVIYPKQPTLACSYRQIYLGNDCCLLLFIDAQNPTSLPGCRFLGLNTTTEIIRKKWQRNGRKWSNERSFIENLSLLLETNIPGCTTTFQKEEWEIECGICYAGQLPLGDDSQANNGEYPDYTCDNPCCQRAFHTVCLRDWLRSITTTKKSFDVLFGSCPYCSDPVAVKINAS
ncbi:E3 ubiquitin-protein ligase FANCL [Apostasia shenzhenica]|uniref:E3 ubiquitin-protein ligase FANCL n=1 Tax=Apostasia shenzhenica TaxID=1088818 RepID=A0A2I0ARQ2_9ASPA|nr:E3 ubiquitin-protein ligase FANCL [Apostasia shenzhenica]